MELRQLKYLLSIADEGTFTAAAEKLFISQSALSQQVKSMEEELGVPLFDRSRNRIRFTQAGELLHNRARRIVKEVDAAKTAIDELEDLCRGTLTVGVVQTVNAYLMPRVASAFSAQFPDVQLRIEELPAPKIEQQIYNHELDLGITFSPAQQTDLKFDAIFEEELLFIAHADHSFSSKCRTELKGLHGQNLVLLSRDYCTRRIWEECAEKAGIRPNVQIEMNTIGAILSTLQNHTGVGTVLPALTMGLEAAAGLTSVKLRNPTPKRTVGLVWRNGGYRTKASQKFARIIEEEYRSMHTH